MAPAPRSNSHATSPAPPATATPRRSRCATSVSSPATPATTNSRRPQRRARHVGLRSRSAQHPRMGRVPPRRTTRATHPRRRRGRPHARSRVGRGSRRPVPRRRGRHTLITTAARTDSAAGALTSFAPLIDHWHTSGAWTQLWITIRALIDVLSRDGHHHDVALLLGAYAASAARPPLFGFDAQRLDNAANAARGARRQLRRHTRRRRRPRRRRRHRSGPHSDPPNHIEDVTSANMRRHDTGHAPKHLPQLNLVRPRRRPTQSAVGDGLLWPRSVFWDGLEMVDIVGRYEVEGAPRVDRQRRTLYLSVSRDPW